LPIIKLAAAVAATSQFLPTASAAWSSTFSSTWASNVTFHKLVPAQVMLPGTGLMPTIHATTECENSWGRTAR
jgi:hypothetical protein